VVRKGIDGVDTEVLAESLSELLEDRRLDVGPGWGEVVVASVQGSTVTLGFSDANLDADDAGYDDLYVVKLTIKASHMVKGESWP